MLLEAAHISKRFGSRPQVLTDVSFGVEPGEFVSVIGPSGAGKTTLFRILNGTLPCDGGEVCIDGQPFSRARGRAKRAVQKRIGTIYQDFALVEPVTCRQNVLNACLPDMALPAALLGLFSRAQIAEAERLLARVGLADKCDDAQKVHCGSAGLLISVKQRQRAQKQGADALWLPPLGGKQFKFRQIFRNLLNCNLQDDPSLSCKMACLRIGPPG